MFAGRMVGPQRGQRGGGFEAVVEGGEIIRRGLHALGVVSECPERGVTRRAEKSANLAGLMAMIDAQPTLLGCFLADCAGAVLPRQSELVLERRHAIALEQARAFASGGRSAASCTVFRIVCPSASFALLVLGFVGGMVAAFGFQFPFSGLGA